MFQFVYWLKAFAAVFITNSHYANIWPIKAIAHGGHLGNCLFFLLSGFCLYYIGDHFLKWYGKRFVRIYPALWITVVVDLLAERIHIGSLQALFRCCIFPTWYHFITSIMLLYVVYYVLRSIQNRYRISCHWLLVGTLLLFVMMYVLFFDKSGYNIDNAGKGWVRWQFFLSMLVGAMLRENYDRISSRISLVEIVSAVVFLVAYFLGKILGSRRGMLLHLQIMVPIFLVCFITFVAIIAIKLEKQGFFARINSKISAIPKFVSGLTLEIYLGQLLILWKFESLPFPVDFVVVTGMILLYAWIVHKCAGWIGGKLETLLRL